MPWLEPLHTRGCAGRCSPAAACKSCMVPLTGWGPLQRFGKLDVVHNIGLDAIPAPRNLQQRYTMMKGLLLALLMT